MVQVADQTGTLLHRSMINITEVCFSFLLLETQREDFLYKNDENIIGVDDGGDNIRGR